MSKLLAIVFILAGFGLIISFQNCGSPLVNKNQQSQSSATISGVVVKSEIAGCNKLIVSDADQNSKFIPFGIPPQSLNEGDHVTATGSFPEDVYSNCMAGVIFRIEKLEKVEQATEAQ